MSSTDWDVLQKAGLNTTWNLWQEGKLASFPWNSGGWYQYEVTLAKDLRTWEVYPDTESNDLLENDRILPYNSTSCCHFTLTLPLDSL